MEKDGASFDDLVSSAPADAQWDDQPAIDSPGVDPRYDYDDRTLFDRLEDDFASTPTGERILRWIGPALVLLIAIGTRLWNLGVPHALVFDETFYVKDAYTLSHLGYEASWPADADTKFNSGITDIFLKSGSFVVHPPLGKWLISLGINAFGAQNAFGWRISTAIVGILAVALIMAIAHYLFRSRIVTTIAGLLFAIDGSAIVMSRISILDNFVMFFALLGFGAVLLDRQWTAVRLAAWIEKRDRLGKTTDWGPSLWWRPWLIAAGVLFGLDSAVKWNGIYFLAGLAIYSVVSDALARRSAGIPFWVTGTLFRQAPVSFVLMVPTALVAYMSTWIGWFSTQGGYDRTWADNPVNAWKGAFAWVPHSVQSFIRFENEIYQFNINAHSTHPYSANPLTWLLMIRPTSMYFAGDAYGSNGCASAYCGTSITGIANPLIWWGGTVAILYLVYRLVRFREWRAGIILAGMGAGYLPWLLYTGRTVFQFYTIAFEPFMILALAYVASLLIGARGDPPGPREWGARWIAIFLVLAVAISVFFWPLWAGIQVDYVFLQAHWWLPTWR